MEPFYESVPAFIFSFGATGHLRTVNDYMLSQLGYTAADLIPHGKIDSLLDIGSKMFFQTHFAPLIRLNGKAEEIYLTFRTAGGDDIPLVLNVAVRDTVEGQVMYAIGMRISQRVRFERELREAKRGAEDALLRIEELALTKESLNSHRHEVDQGRSTIEQQNRELKQINEIMSHDLQEPVRKTSILLDRYIQQRRDSLSDTDIAQLRNVIAISGGMSNLLRNLQTYNAVANVSIPVVPVDLNLIVAQLRQQYAEEIRLRDATILAIGLPASIEGQYDLLYTLFKNILENSLKFYDPQKPELLIEIRASIIDRNVYTHTKDKYHYTDHSQITFQDNGVGFDTQYSNKMFSLFRKLTTDKSYIGVGLGLAVAKKIVDLHRGTITAASGPHGGSIITITLPMIQKRS